MKISELHFPQDRSWFEVRLANRNELIILTQIVMGYASLKRHLHIMGYVDDPKSKFEDVTAHLTCHSDLFNSGHSGRDYQIFIPFYTKINHYTGHNGRNILTILNY